MFPNYITHHTPIQTDSFERMKLHVDADKIRKSEQGTGIAQIQRPEVHSLCGLHVGKLFWIWCLCEEW